MPKKNDWTVFFLVEAVEGFTAEVKLMLEDILTVKKYPETKVSVVLCISGKVGSINAAGLPYAKSYRETSESGTTAFYELVSDNKGETNFAFIGKKINFNIHSEKNIRAFFRSQILLRNRADKYLLFTWDHGSVFGIFKDTETLGDQQEEDVHGADGNTTQKSLNIVSNAKVHNIITFTKSGPKSNTPATSANKHVDKKISFRQLCHLQKIKIPNKLGFNILTMTSLSRALRKAILKKIDLLVMMNCCMQYFDSGYELRSAVDYLVAPETIMDFYGYNYSKMLNYLFENGAAVNGLQMANKTIEFYNQKIYETPELTNYILNSSAIFANELKYYDTIGGLINNISKKLLNTPKGQFSAIIAARHACANILSVGAYNLLDFFTFLESLKKDPVFENDQDVIALSNLKTIIVKSQHVGKDTLVNGAGVNINPSAFSVYFPKSRSYNTNSPFFNIYVSPASKYVTPFSKTSSWPKFIEKYLNIAPNLPIR